ncbi:uncharacterized protein MEPE_01734 [Melanopsichium pennsylvanicum]|uniref:Transglycosylase SLT domain-containing protein n=2 Tax=Melanopsichium pennsylvanicum TaxID=63383 RepID=A0AAJ4XJ14_9BASI|nr:hypothetical protein BN887_04646 [Melanopsichium pennsylvanicum 4]SNX83028.1 uncharacterized protein MEPE_01734 [Melanopsichium pennsylvanicum]
MMTKQDWSTGLLCFLVALTLNNATNAAVIPQKAPTKLVPINALTQSSPTPLPVVSTYTLYFGSQGATVAAPVLSSQSVAPVASSNTGFKSAMSSSATPARSTAKCSVKKSSAISVSASTNIASKSVTSNQTNTIFPTVAPAIPTLNTKNQRLMVSAEAVLPHSFMNKVDSLVETYQGITGRKARQVALVLANQTNVIANTSKAESILSNLAEAYPNNNATAQGVRGNGMLLDWTAATVLTTAAAKDVAQVDSSARSKRLTKLPQQLVMASGRSNITLLSNTPDYGPDQIRHDLHVIRAWGGDLNQLSTRALLDETVAAVMSASLRYFPELSTKDAARMIMADIKAESDFDPNNISGGRLDSGSSWGLMQVSPIGSGELKLFQQHATVKHNTYSWDEQYNVTTTPNSFGSGPLLDWNTDKVLNLKSLTNADLMRPWVNIHVATWIQSNLARTSSQDPYTWSEVYEKSNKFRNANNTNHTKATTAEWLALNQSLIGAGLPKTCLTGLGSWVAGPAVDGYGSYTQKGDDISQPYFRNIAQGLSVLYSKNVQPTWLNSLELRAGLVDYH